MKKTKIYAIQFLAVVAGILLFSSAAFATESGASIWPVGAESVAMASGTPRTGQTRVYEYTCFYEANELDDAHGKKMPIPDFKLRVFANALKLSHNWGVKFLGGEIGSWVAVPYVYQQLHTPGGKYTNNAIGNVNFVPVSVFYHKGDLHWYYEVQFEAAGTGYVKGAEVNIGQHNIALTPAFGITYAPHHGEQELGSRFDYVINDADHATHYHGGNEFVWQFDARQEIPKTKMSLGLVGYYYKQITNDTQNGAAVVTTNADGSQTVGYKGRVLDLGPQVTFPFGKKGGIAVKWTHDLLVENKTRGNSFWFQFSIPFSYLHHPAAQAH
ncbi:MAG: transporter [Acidobacteriota bacterium]|nr:transporter [Acidobacteriota bacterium]